MKHDDGEQTRFRLKNINWTNAITIENKSVLINYSFYWYAFLLEMFCIPYNVHGRKNVVNANLNLTFVPLDLSCARRW